VSIPRSRRHWLVVALALVLTAGAATAGATGLTANASLSGKKDTAAAKPASAAHATSASTMAAGAHPVKFGLDYGSTLSDETTAEIRANLQDAATVGAKWIRVDLAWEKIQPNDSWSYDWSSFDDITQAAGSLGLKVDAILDATAYWDTSPACKAGEPNTEFCPPDELSYFTDFAAAAARRYENSSVGAWEIWNEPNISARWWPEPSPSGYAQMLTSVSQAIRGANPKAFVLMSGLAAVPDPPPAGRETEQDFLTAVAAVPGALADVNAISFHPFSGFVLPSVAGVYQDISASPDNLLSILQKAGYPNLQIWLTEAGVAVGPGVTASNLTSQTAYATNLVQTASKNSDISAAFWFSDQDIPAQQLFWGLRDAQGKARPAFAAFGAAIKACGCSSP